MELVLRVIQGAYAYLLIFLILVVSGLFLALLWLVVRRTKEAGQAAADLLANSQLAPAGTITAPVQAVLGGITKEEWDGLNEENNKLKGKIEVLENDLRATAGSSDRAKELNDKVQYLESKLLEYEILQEEIGTLSALKVENEQLKQRLVASGISLSDSGAGLNPGPATDTLAASGPSIASTAPTPSPSPMEAAPLAVHIPPTEAPVPPVATESSLPIDGNLDALLAEIDKLTTQNDKNSS